MPVGNVLSLFNGISGCHLALERAGVKHGQVYYAEIDKYANLITQHNYPDDIALGDVTKWREWDIDWSSIDLITAGFPCQAWSVAGKQLGDKDERGMLFWVTLDIIKHVLTHNPSAKWLMENVKMKSDFEQYITHHTTEALDYVEKTLINSALVSAQNRQRYYWTNFPVTQPEDKGILLKDIIEDGACDREKSYCIDANYHKGGNLDQYFNKSRRQLVFAASFNRKTGIGKELIKAHTMNASDWRGLNRNQNQTAVVYHPASIVGRRLNDRGVRDDYNKNVPITQCLQVKHKAEKTGCLTTVDKDNVLSQAKPGRYPDIYNRDDIQYRKLTPIECERLQTVPDNFTAVVSNTQRYKALGNGWTIDVIAHILQCGFKSETAIIG